MATWLTHLRIAESIKGRIAAIDFDYLMMGSIAPDSGEPDAEAVNYTPSKDITHSRYKRDDELMDIDETEFFSKYLEPEKIFSRSDKTRSFLWGYYFHLLTDKLWLEQYFRKYLSSFKQESDATEKEFVDFIREEMYSLDFEYLKQHGNDLIAKFEKSETNISFFNEFDVEHIYKCRDKVLSLYKGQPYILNRPYKFLGVDIVDGFVTKAAEKCINTLVY